MDVVIGAIGRLESQGDERDLNYALVNNWDESDEMRRRDGKLMI